MDNISREEVIDFYNQLGLPEQSYVRNGKIRNIYDILGIRPRLKPNGEREVTPYEILKVPPQMVMSKEVPIVFAIKNKVGKIGKYEGDDYTFTYQSRKVKKDLTLLQTLRNNYRKAIYDGDDVLAYRILQMYDKLTGGKGKEFADSFYDYSKFYRRMKKQLIIDLFAHFFLMQEEMQQQTNKFKSVKYGLVGRRKNIRPYRNREFYGVPSVTEEQIEEYERQQAQIQAQAALNQQNERAMLERDRIRRQRRMESPWFIFAPNNRHDRREYDYDIGLKKNERSPRKRKKLFDWKKLGRIFGQERPSEPRSATHEKGRGVNEMTGAEIASHFSTPNVSSEEINYIRALNQDINDLKDAGQPIKDAAKGNVEPQNKKGLERESEATLERHLDYN